MTSLFFETENTLPNPLDLAEQVLIDRDWAYDRPDDEELVAEVAKAWGNYRIWFSWQQELGGLIFSCALECKLPEHAKQKIYTLLALVNEKLWLGHFDVCSEEKSIMFRHAQIFRGDNRANSEQLSDLIDIAITECERFYPAFQSVVWGGKTPEEALQIAIFDTVGEA